jgi:hypothetical protein
MMTPGDLLLISVAGTIGGIAAAYASPLGWLAATLVASVAALGASVWILRTGTVWDWQPDFQVAGEPIHLHLDGLNALFLALLSVLGGVGGCTHPNIGPTIGTRFPPRWACAST